VNDPLNWSIARKYWHAFLVCFIAGLTAATSNNAASAQFGENDELGISYDAMNTGAGVLFIDIGYGTLLISPAAWLWGRRITYLFCITIGFVGAIWMARTRSTADSIWNQLFVGASESCAEANVQLSLSDVFYEHQRGTFLGVYVLSTSIGTYLGPLVASYIADSSLDWRWIGWCAVIISRGALVLLYFTLEETLFERSLYQTDENTTPPGSKEDDFDLGTNEKKSGAPMGGRKTLNDDSAVERQTRPSRPKTYLERIALITPASNLVGFGVKQYLSRLLHTLRVFSFPAVIFFRRAVGCAGRMAHLLPYS
jgi:MFS family permease